MRADNLGTAISCFFRSSQHPSFIHLCLPNKKGRLLNQQHYRKKRATIKRKNRVLVTSNQKKGALAMGDIKYYFKTFEFEMRLPTYYLENDFSARDWGLQRDAISMHCPPKPPPYWLFLLVVPTPICLPFKNPECWKGWTAAILRPPALTSPKV